MKKMVIYGTGDFGILADYYFTYDLGRKPVAFTTHAEFKDRDEYLERPVIPFESLPKLCPPETHELFVAISYNKFNTIRTKRVADARAAGYDLTSCVSPKAIVAPGVTYGYNCFIRELSSVEPFAKIGNNVILLNCAQVCHHVIVEDNCFIAIGAIVLGRSVIGQDSFVGANATIRDHVRIGKRCVIGAGAVVLRDVPDGAIVAPKETEKWSIGSTNLRADLR